MKEYERGVPIKERAEAEYKEEMARNPVSLLLFPFLSFRFFFFPRHLFLILGLSSFFYKSRRETGF
jgi:hypothetical protein